MESVNWLATTLFSNNQDNWNNVSNDTFSNSSKDNKSEINTQKLKEMSFGEWIHRIEEFRPSNTEKIYNAKNNSYEKLKRKVKRILRWI